MDNQKVNTEMKNYQKINHIQQNQLLITYMMFGNEPN